MGRKRLPPLIAWQRLVSGGRKGGRVRGARRTGHSFTSDEARKISLKYWNRQRKKVSSRRSISCGRKTRTAYLKRQPIRVRYSQFPPNNEHGLWCQDAKANGWYLVSPDGYMRWIQERTALVRLGIRVYWKPRKTKGTR